MNIEDYVIPKSGTFLIDEPGTATDRAKRARSETIVKKTCIKVKMPNP